MGRNLGTNNIVEITEGTARSRDNQDKEELLCQACEAAFSGREDYVAGVVLQTNGKFPALDMVTTLQTDDVWDVGDGSSLDTEQLAYFAASIVWRASESQLYPNTILGSTYSVPFKEYLLGKAPLPEETRVAVELIQRGTGPHIERMVVPPESRRTSEGFALHQFLLFGVLFRVCVGQKLPAELDKICILRSQRVTFRGYPPRSAMRSSHGRETEGAFVVEGAVAFSGGGA